MQKNYYAIIPANVRYDEKLIPSAKLLYGEITALCNEKGYCWASNSYFAKLYGVSVASVKNWLKSLEDGGYIDRVVKYKEGSKEIESRWITILTHPRVENLPTPVRKVADPRQENWPDNNTSNNTINNTKDIMSGKPDNVPYEEIIEYLNQKSESNYRSKTASTRKYIKARFNEGFTIDDFKTVIDKKTKEWKGDEKWGRFLRPETLFGTKFEGYLNQKEKNQRGNGYDTSEYENFF